MNYLAYLKRNKQHYLSRWIVKYDNDLVREVKLIFNPEEYKKGLIKILENDRQKRNT